jgi:uncharacterized membrane protein
VLCPPVPQHHKRSSWDTYGNFIHVFINLCVLYINNKLWQAIC